MTTDLHADLHEVCEELDLIRDEISVLGEALDALLGEMRTLNSLILPIATDFANR